MQIVEMTGLSYPQVRATIDLFEAGGWGAIRPALRGRSPGDGRVLSPAQAETIQRMIIDPALIILNFPEMPSCMGDASNRYEIVVARSAA
jgi:hypothetical protein